MDEMFAGVGANGAEDAWMDLAIAVEHWQLSGPPFAGGATDIVKCVDQIDRDLLLARLWLYRQISSLITIFTREHQKVPCKRMII